MNTADPDTEIARFELGSGELAEVSRVVETIIGEFPDDQGPDFLAAATLYSHELPKRLRRFLLDVREREDAAAVVVSGFPVDDQAIGPTPGGAGQLTPTSTRSAEIWLVLCGSLLGDLFGWATQQSGRLIHDIAPMRADAHKQVGAGSAELLWWHTEEAFHPLRCDYLGLCCLRNHDRVPTTFASIGHVDLDPAIRRVLFQRRFVIRPDDSHLVPDERADIDGGELLAAARDRITDMNERPDLVALLSGDFDNPYLTIDPYYMDVPETDAEASEAYRSLCAAIDGHIAEIALEPGEILFIDNYRAVHGRSPFRARYDGTDRWLKRINITRDLRKSRSLRGERRSRVVH